MNVEKLNEWLKSHDFDCTVDLSLDSDYCYDVSEEVIYIGTLADNCENRFRKYAYKLGLRTNASIEVLAFLHELGHHMTMPYIDETIIDKDNLIKILMDRVPNTRLTVPVKYYIYYRLPIEKVATAWAIEYLTANPAEAIRLRKLLKGE